MFRHKSSRTPKASRRTTRAVRHSAKRRRSEGRKGSGGGLKEKFEKAAERPAKKWVQIYRSPAPNVSFQVKTWVPYSKLTDEERKEYEERLERGATLARKAKQPEEKEAENNGKSSEKCDKSETQPSEQFEMLESNKISSAGEQLETPSIQSNLSANETNKPPVDCDSEEEPTSKRAKIDFSSENLGLDHMETSLESFNEVPRLFPDLPFDF